MFALFTRAVSFIVIKACFPSNDTVVDKLAAFLNDSQSLQLDLDHCLLFYLTSRRR